MEVISCAARILQGHRWAKKTAASLNSKQKLFIQFCALAGVNTLPVASHVLVNYSAWLVLTGHIKSADSLVQYISGVSVLHKQYGLACVTPKQFGPLDALVQGMKKMAKRPVRRSLPITPVILYNLLHSIPPINSGWLELTILSIFKTFTLILYMSMLRSSSLVPASMSELDLERQLVWGKIRRTEVGLVISITLSKTIQSRERIQEVPLARHPDPALCPVRALDALVSLRGHHNCGESTTVFQLPDGKGGWRQMIKPQYEEWFKFRIKQMGLDPSKYMLHGFRHGSIQECFLVEDSVGIVKVTSDHASEAVMVYSGIPAERRMMVSHKMSSSLSAQFCGFRRHL